MLETTVKCLLLVRVMPPRIRTRASKALKENIDITENKLKPAKTNTKAPRKPLADKTNSASDDPSLEIPTKVKKTSSNKNGEKKAAETKKKQTVKHKDNVKPNENVKPTNEGRPRRERKLPNQFVENVILKNLSNSKESPNVTVNSSTTTLTTEKTPVKKTSVSKNDITEPSPFKTPSKVDSSLFASRPTRICRLPSRLEDHSVSPHKYIPILPAHASTPIQPSKARPIVLINKNEITCHNVDKNLETKATKTRPIRLAKLNAQKKSSDKTPEKSSPDGNNNAKGRTRKKATKIQPPATKKSPDKIKQSPIRKFLTPMAKFQSSLNKTQSPAKKSSPKQSANKKTDKNLSFKLLGSKKKSQETENKDQDVYEFTFDPNEEPKPQKKKRKRIVTKKSAPTPNPRKVVCKSTYDKNIKKALAALKNAIQPAKTTEAPKLPQITENTEQAENVQQSNATNNFNVIQTNNITNTNNMALNDTGKTSVHECNYPSIRVEDIAADIEPSIDHHADLNYSPVNSPRSIGFKTPNTHQSLNHRETPERSVQNKDPLNLAEELSFFDDQPVASSSMNMSVRHPLASPWRVEFGNLPIKWPSNAYVKPNMTPAVETSFINPEDSINKKKHVYTNMVPQTNEMFTDIADTTPNLKQTSIISFIKEMAEKSAKKKRGRSVSPAKAIYQEIDDNNAETNKKSGKKGVGNKTPNPAINTSDEVSSSGNDTSHDKENSKEERKSRKRKNNENICDLPAKSPRKQKDKDGTFFGFDESEVQDENVSPVKINNNPRSRSLRPRSKAVLQEINGPTRAVLPVAAKTKIATGSEAVNKVYEELKSPADAPVFLERNVNENETNVADPSINDDSQSVHLFEDIEVVHHLKPTRKSYGKAKKVTFRQRSNSTSDSEVQVPVEDPNESTDYDDLGDLTFDVCNVTEKKATKKRKPKKLMSKKEEKEAEAWAANFNSMCEDVEDFPLLVE